MHAVRIGLYWRSVVFEMPKLAYDSRYGTIFVNPFYFSWLSLLTLPLLALTRSEKTLKKINKLTCSIAYLPISLCLLAIFMAVNAALIPFSYLKTIAHKFILLYRSRFRSLSKTKNLVFFILLGVPILVIS